LSLTPSGLTSTPTAGATAWIAANCGAPLRLFRSTRTITFRMPGEISLSTSSNFAPNPNSAERKPVALPPGCARLCTIPKPTGSVTAANTIGTERLTFCRATTLGGDVAKTTSGASPTNSFARSRKLSSPAPNRTSTCRFVPGLQPSPCIAFWNAATRAAISASVSSPGTNTPIRRVCGPCCACTTSGHVATPPTSVMKSRRLIVVPDAQDEASYQPTLATWKWWPCPLCANSGHLRQLQLFWLALLTLNFAALITPEFERPELCLYQPVLCLYPSIQLGRRRELPSTLQSRTFS